MCIPILLNLVVLASCYPIGARSEDRSSGLVAYGRLKTIELLKPTALKVVAVAYEKCSLTRGSEYSEFRCQNFGISDKWSFPRGGRTGRFHCI